MKAWVKTLLIVVGAIAALCILLGLIFVSPYNKMVSLGENVDSAYSSIQTQLQRRSDLIPNLVSTVKGYAAHEEEVYTAIADARSALAGATNATELSQASNALDSALSRLLVIVENYPELQANQNFIALQDQLEGTENRIAVARNDYNEAVQTYNTRIRKFPTNLLASLFGFEQRDYFEADASAQDVPQVSFDS